MFTDIQKQEMLGFAEEIVSSAKWNALPWKDALNSAYPLRPSSEEIEREAKALELKASRIIARGLVAEDYADITEHTRMIYLEAATTFNIFSRSAFRK